MSTPQSGIFDRSYAHHGFFEFSLGSGHKTESLRQALRDLVALKSEKTPVLLGFGPDLWACFDSRFSFPPFSLYLPAMCHQSVEIHALPPCVAVVFICGAVHCEGPVPGS